MTTQGFEEDERAGATAESGLLGLMDIEPTYRPRIRPSHGYYRQPNGWITVAVVTELEELQYRKEGWQPLTQYGRFDMLSKYTADNPLEWLLMQGGAKELCEEQIREQGLYMNPLRLPTCRQPITQFHKRHVPRCWVGAKRVVFPQVESMKGLGPFPCEFCSRKLPTIEARNQHMSVVHRTDMDNIQTGKSLAEALVSGLQRSGVSVAAREGQEDATVVALRAITNAGLTKKQRELLAAAGVTVPAEVADAG